MSLTTVRIFFIIKNIYILIPPLLYYLIDLNYLNRLFFLLVVLPIVLLIYTTVITGFFLLVFVFLFLLSKSPLYILELLFPALIYLQLVLAAYFSTVLFLVLVDSSKQKYYFLYFVVYHQLIFELVNQQAIICADQVQHHQDFV